MATPSTRFNYSVQQWQACKEEVTAILRSRLAVKEPITYTELVNTVQSIRFAGAIDERLYALLGDVSADTNEQDGTMLSVMVVREEDRSPGPGFFRLARLLGRKGDDEAIWVTESKKLGL